MRGWIANILGTNKLFYEQKKTNQILLELLKELRRNSDLVEAYNKRYHIK